MLFKANVADGGLVCQTIQSGQLKFEPIIIILLP